MWRMSLFGSPCEYCSSSRQRVERKKYKKQEWVTFSEGLSLELALKSNTNSTWV